jgi:hypothetical protein
MIVLNGRQKRHEGTNMGEVRPTRIMIVTLHYVTSGSGLTISGRLIFVVQSERGGRRGTDVGFRPSSVCFPT